MTSLIRSKKILVTSSLLLALAVLIGAFGAHGLKSLVSAERLVTFETGVRYHFYHAFGIMLLGLMENIFSEISLKQPITCFFVGILLFSFNCYFYVLSDLKIFAILVPLGGILFVTGWMILAWKLLKLS